jgi:hypothetical protein
LISYMKGRASTVVDWPNTSEVFFIACWRCACSIIINCYYDFCVDH